MKCSGCHALFNALITLPRIGLSQAKQIPFRGEGKRGKVRGDRTEGEGEEERG